MRKITSTMLLLLIPLFCFGETVVLKSGQTIEGKIIEKTEEYLKIDFYGVPLTYYFDDIESIDGNRNFAKKSELVNQDVNMSVVSEENIEIIEEDAGLPLSPEKVVDLSDNEQQASEHFGSQDFTEGKKQDDSGHEQAVGQEIDSPQIYSNETVNDSDLNEPHSYGKNKSFFAKISSLLGFKRDEEAIKKKRERLLNRLRALEEALIKADENIERILANPPVCPRTGEKGKVWITQDSRVEIRKEIEKTKKEILELDRQ